MLKKSSRYLQVLLLTKKKNFKFELYFGKFQSIEFQTEGRVFKSVM